VCSVVSVCGCVSCVCVFVWGSLVTSRVWPAHAPVLGLVSVT